MTKAVYLERERRKAEIKARPRRLPSKEYMTVTVNPTRLLSTIQDDFYRLMAALPPKVRRDFWAPVSRPDQGDHP